MADSCVCYFVQDSFDFIHARNVSSGISDWGHFMSDVFRCVTPDGYVELCENAVEVHCDGSMKPDNGAKVSYLPFHQGQR
jgi:hypothetical protein